MFKHSFLSLSLVAPRHRWVKYVNINRMCRMIIIFLIPVDKRTGNNLYMRLDLVWGEIDQGESMWRRGGELGGGELSMGRNQQLPFGQRTETVSSIACVASVSVGFGSKERPGTEVLVFCLREEWGESLLLLSPFFAL